MAFASGRDVMSCVESLMRHLWRVLLDVKLKEERFPIMTYWDAMSKYGTDKPDTRLGMEVRLA